MFSERTIRYAESGKPIRPDLAERLARVLSYSMDALLVNVQELNTVLLVNSFTGGAMDSLRIAAYASLYGICGKRMY